LALHSHRGIAAIQWRAGYRSLQRTFRHPQAKKQLPTHAERVLAAVSFYLLDRCLFVIKSNFDLLKLLYLSFNMINLI
jgi:hypothetical protein